MKNTPKAVEILGDVLVQYPQLIDEETINILTELCIISKAYEQVYEVCTHNYDMDGSLQNLGMAALRVDLSLGSLYVSVYVATVTVK